MLLGTQGLLGLGCDEATKCTDFDEGADRDSCFKEQIQGMDATELEGVKSVALEIDDTMVRSYAVSTWVKDHSNEISLEQGTGLCQLLEGREQSYCLRRLSSPHLQR
jgi:hypothetical protein